MRNDDLLELNPGKYEIENAIDKPEAIKKLYLKFLLMKDTKLYNKKIMIKEV